MAKEFAYLVVFMSAFGCASDPPAGTKAKNSQPAPTVLTVETADGVFESVFPATLIVRPTEQELGIGASNGPDMWNAIGVLADEDVEVGSSTLPITTSPLSAGAASVSRQGASGQVQSATETLTLNIGKGTISGEVASATPEKLNATFTGPLAVECWVEAKDIPGGGPDSGLVDDSTTTFLVLDENLASPACAGLSVLRP